MRYKDLRFSKDMFDSSAPKRLGYARVSTVGQTLEAQFDQLKAAGCSRIFREKVSGAKVDRKELGKLLKTITAGDQVVVTRIDRLARPVFELFAIVKKIIDAGGQFLSLAEPWADTSTGAGRFMIAVLGGLADVERDLIRTRTGEGRARAKLRGQNMGRPPKMTPSQAQEARRRRKDGESVADLARSYGVSPAAIYRTTA